MSNVTVWFIRCAIVYFVLAALLGITMTISGPLYPLGPIHTHLNLLGWMSMMIFGVAYHILPRFSGVPLWSDRLAMVQLWLANIGLIGMGVGWTLLGMGSSFVVLHVFALVEGVAIIIFAVNMLKTIKAGPAYQPKP